MQVKVCVLFPMSTVWHLHTHMHMHECTHTHTPLVCRLVMNNEPCWSCQRSQQQFVKSCQAPLAHLLKLPSPSPLTLSLCHLRLHFDAATRCAVFHSIPFRFILWFNGLTNTNVKREGAGGHPLPPRTGRPRQVQLTGFTYWEAFKPNSIYCHYNKDIIKMPTEFLGQTST